MIIEWADKKSCLTHGVKKYKAGDKIPDGVLSATRLDYFLSKKKIKVVSEKKVVEPEKPVEPEVSEEPVLNSYSKTERYKKNKRSKSDGDSE